MAAAYCYEGIPLRFLASLLITDALSSVYEISTVRHRMKTTITGHALMKFLCGYLAGTPSSWVSGNDRFTSVSFCVQISFFVFS